MLLLHVLKTIKLRFMDKEAICIALFDTGLEHIVF